MAWTWAWIHLKASLSSADPNFVFSTPQSLSTRQCQTYSYIVWVWIFPAELWPRYSQASCVAVLHSAVTKILVVHILKMVWVYLHVAQGFQGRSVLKCEELLTWADKIAKQYWAMQKKVVLKVYKLLFLYSSKKYASGRKKSQYY